MRDNDDTLRPPPLSHASEEIGNGDRVDARREVLTDAESEILAAIGALTREVSTLSAASCAHTEAITLHTQSIGKLNEQVDGLLTDMREAWPVLRSARTLPPRSRQDSYSDLELTLGGTHYKATPEQLDARTDARVKVAVDAALKNRETGLEAKRWRWVQGTVVSIVVGTGLTIVLARFWSWLGRILRV